jgi:L-serine deaminase
MEMTSENSGREGSVPSEFDTTVEAMALTAKEMNAKETSEGGLAVSLVLC